VTGGFADLVLEEKAILGQSPGRVADGQNDKERGTDIGAYRRKVSANGAQPPPAEDRSGTLWGGKRCREERADVGDFAKARGDGIVGAGMA